MKELNYYKLVETIKDSHKQLEEFITHLEETTKRLGLDKQNNELTDKKVKEKIDGLINFYTTKLDKLDKQKRKLADIATE